MFIVLFQRVPWWRVFFKSNTKVVLVKLVEINLKPLPFTSRIIFFIGVAIIVLSTGKLVYTVSIVISVVYSFERFISSQKKTEASKKPKKVLGMFNFFFKMINILQST